MNGFLIIFYTSQNRRYQGQPISEWLLAVAKQMNLRGATVLAGMMGVDHHGQMHSAHFFELADQPIQIQFAVTPEQATTLLDYLNSQTIELFYVKTPIEFGFVGQTPSDSQS
jgi:PII-like signaling protein